MSKKTIKTFVCNLFCLAMILTNFNVSAQNKILSPKKNNHLYNPLNDRHEYYKKQYPEILFLVLNGGDEILDEMMVLGLLLGYEPMSMDYEHPPNLREDLMIVSGERIWDMLKNQSPSASLFKADTPLGWQEHICVLTISPQKVADNSFIATEHLLNLDEKLIKQIPSKFQLQPADYLEFVFDHEVYHCLQSMYVGPQQMSNKEFWAQYNQFLDEQGADAYALGMHIKSRGEVSPFARNILRIRSMALYNTDPDHLTYRALDKVLKLPIKTISDMNSKQIFEMANRIRDELTIDYNEYLQYLAAALKAMQELGIEPQLSEELVNSLKGIETQQSKVRELLENAQSCLKELRGDNLKP